MSIRLIETDYKNYKKIPYFNGGIDVSSSYINDLEELSAHLEDHDKYLDNSIIQLELSNFSKNLPDEKVDELNEYITNAIIENERLSKEELKNKLNYAIKTENIFRNIDNNDKYYSGALQKMVTEDISLNNLEIDRLNKILHNKKRNLEIRHYYDEKMKTQIEIVKAVIVILLILLAITMLYKMNILNTNVYIISIGIGLACCVLLIVGRLIDILMRDNNKFDEYAYIRSHHYLNKGNGKNELLEDIPLHNQDDLISDECLRVMNDNDDDE